MVCVHAVQGGSLKVEFLKWWLQTLLKSKKGFECLNNFTLLLTKVLTKINSLSAQMNRNVMQTLNAIH